MTVSQIPAILRNNKGKLEIQDTLCLSFFFFLSLKLPSQILSKTLSVYVFFWRDSQKSPATSSTLTSHRGRPSVTSPLPTYNFWPPAVWGLGCTLCMPQEKWEWEVFRLYVTWAALLLGGFKISSLPRTNALVWMASSESPHGDFMAAATNSHKPWS